MQPPIFVDEEEMPSNIGHNQNEMSINLHGRFEDAYQDLDVESNPSSMDTQKMNYRNQKMDKELQDNSLLEKKKSKCQYFIPNSMK